MALPTTAETRDFANFSDNGDGTTSRMANVTSSALPAGAATESALQDILTEAENLNAKDFATETTLADARDLLSSLEAYEFATETTLGSAVAELLTLNAKDFATSAKQDTIIGHVDGIEVLIAGSNAKLDSVNTNLGTIDSRVDGLETLIGSSNTKLDSVNSNLVTIDGRVDGLETLVGSTNTKLDSINANVDGVETLIGSTNTKLDTINASVDGLETLTGPVTETAPVTDIASSGLNGRLQRVAQRLTSILANLGVATSDPSNTAQGLVTRNIPVERLTYAASTDGFLSAALATDIFTVTGSASKTIRIKSMSISGRTTSGSPVPVVIKLLKRSTASTGGVSLATTAVPLDSTSAAATGTAKHYTTSPALLGTLVGNIKTRSIAFQAAGLVEIINCKFETPLVLRGVAESVSFNLNMTTITGSSIACSAVWEEV